VPLAGRRGDDEILMAQLGGVQVVDRRAGGLLRDVRGAFRSAI
jgi:hypothetical protein